MLPHRTLWQPGFPDVVVHATLPERDNHPDFLASKAGNPDAALRLARELLSTQATEALRRLVGPGGAVLLPITALEEAGFNAILDAMATTLAANLSWRLSSGNIVQINRVGHTRARSFNRLVTPAEFSGRVIRGANYVLVDDHVGLGGTLANLKGYVEVRGGRVVAMTTLTESPQAHRIALQPDLLHVLKDKHGEALESLWRKQVGHGLDRLTNVEAGVLARQQSVDAIRDRLAQAAIEVGERGLVPIVQLD
jgi:hypothetical protein